MSESTPERAKRAKGVVITLAFTTDTDPDTLLDAVMRQLDGVVEPVTAAKAEGFGCFVLDLADGKPARNAQPEEVAVGPGAPYSSDELGRQLRAVNPIEDPKLYGDIFGELIKTLHAEHDRRLLTALSELPPEPPEEPS